MSGKVVNRIERLEREDDAPAGRPCCWRIIGLHSDDRGATADDEDAEGEDAAPPTCPHGRAWAIVRVVYDETPIPADDTTGGGRACPA